MRKRIAIVTFSAALPGEKGLDRLYFLARLFAGSGYEVDFITSAFHHWSKSFRDSRLIWGEAYLKVTLCEELGYTKNIQIKRIISHWVLASNIQKYIGTQSYDVVYCHIPDNHLASVVASYAKKRNIPFVIDVEDLWPEAMRMVLDVPILSDVFFSYFSISAKRAYQKADAVIGSSDAYRDEPHKYGIEVQKRLTVYVGNDLKKFDQEVKENVDKVIKPENEFWVTYAGSLGTSYDITTLIRASAILLERGEQNIRVMILGDGPKRADFEAVAKSCDCNVSFLGYLPHSMMATFLSKSDITVNSLVRKAAQGFVSKIGDYLAAGKPMINTGLNKEFWTTVEIEGWGLNVKPEEPELLANAIQELKQFDSRRRKMGRLARQVAEEKYDRNSSYKNIVNLVNELLEK